MRKFIALILALFINTSLIVSADTIYQLSNPNTYNYVNTVTQSSIDKLFEIENSMYGRTYGNQELLARIERLENTIYNRYYPNYTIAERLDNLIYNYNYSRNNQLARTNKIKRIVNAINSVIIGVPTGYTPPISVQY